MRKLLSSIVALGMLASCSDNGSGEHGGHHEDSAAHGKSKDTTKKSLPAQVNKFLGNTDVTINYHAPAVRGRVIWGGLVAYDQVWVTGAHSATSFEVGKDFIAGGKTIKAGKYAIFTIPGKEEWTVIINKNWEQHLADDYSETEDVARIKVKPQTTDDFSERLKYEIDQTGERTANIIISWEKIRVPFSIEVR